MMQGNPSTEDYLMNSLAQALGTSTLNDQITGNAGCLLLAQYGKNITSESVRCAYAGGALWRWSSGRHNPSHYRVKSLNVVRAWTPFDIAFRAGWRLRDNTDNITLSVNNRCANDAWWQR